MEWYESCIIWMNQTYYSKLSENPLIYWKLFDFHFAAWPSRLYWSAIFPEAHWCLLLIHIQSAYAFSVSFSCSYLTFASLSELSTFPFLEKAFPCLPLHPTQFLLPIQISIDFVAFLSPTFSRVLSFSYVFYHLSSFWVANQELVKVCQFSEVLLPLEFSKTFHTSPLLT